MGTSSADGLEAGRILSRLAETLPDASPMAQAFVLMLAQRGEARLAVLAKALDLPQALALRAATELTALADDMGAPIASFTPGRSPGAGLLRLTDAGARLARHAIGQSEDDHFGGQTGRTDH